jgi:hypothetical protein
MTQKRFFSLCILSILFILSQFRPKNLSTLRTFPGFGLQRPQRISSFIRSMLMGSTPAWVGDRRLQRFALSDPDIVL